jgi:hypothetical protein
MMQSEFLNISKLALTLAATTMWFVSAPAQSFVYNGDFSQGNTNFTSDYGYVSPMYWQPDHYTVDTNCPLGYKDHTTGAGNYLIVDGDYSSESIVWAETINVTPNTDYLFEAWARCLTAGPIVTLSFQANGAAMGTISLVNPPDSRWQCFSSVWNSGSANSVALRIFDLQTDNGIPGNDFGIDDISLRTVLVPEPSAFALVMAGGCLFRLVRRRSSQTKQFVA